MNSAYATQNYQTPEGLVKGLLNFMTTQNILSRHSLPKKGCYCRSCRLVRKSAKFAGVSIKNI